MISPGFRLFEFFFIVGGAKPLLSTCRRLVHLWPVIGLPAVENSFLSLFLKDPAGM